MKPTHRLRFLLLQTSAALALLVNLATAATFTWTGAADPAWSNAGNWTGGVPAVANTTDVIISGTTNVFMRAGDLTPTLRSLTFDDTNDADTTLRLYRTDNPGSAGKPLTFSSDSGNATLTVAADSTGNKNINGGNGAQNITLTSSLDIIHNGSGILNFNSTTIITSAGGINKSGTGTLSLQGVNDYSGATTVTAGTLALGHATDTLSSSSAVTVDGATAVLSIAGNSDTVGAVSLKNGGSITGSGGTLTGASYALESGSVSAILGGAGIALTKSTAGTVTLSGTNTYTGTTTIQNGTLALDGAANRLATTAAVVLGDTGTTGKLVLGGTTTAGQTLTSLTTTGLGGSVVGGNAANSMLTLNIASSNTFDGTLGGAGTNENNLTLAKTSAGSLTLTGNNTFSGGISIPANGGTLIAGHNNALGTASVSINSNTALELADGITINNPFTATDQGNAKALRLKDGATSATYSGNISILETSFLNFDINVATGGTLTISGIISGNSFEKVGVGTVILTGANTYTGDTTVSAGTLAVDGDSIVNTGKLVIAGGKVDVTGSETVGTLFFGATQQAAGTWGSSSSTAVPPFVDDTRFSGTGVVIVPPSSGYAAWQSANSTAQAANLDHDNDGVSNGVEHFLGGTGNTTGFTTPLPGVTNSAGTLSVTWVRHPDFPGFPGNYGTAVIVETSATLADPWAPAVLGAGAGFVEITGNNVKYTFPAGTKNFARLKVTIP